MSTNSKREQLPLPVLSKKAKKNTYMDEIFLTYLKPPPLKDMSEEQLGELTGKNLDLWGASHKEKRSFNFS